MPNDPVSLMIRFLMLLTDLGLKPNTTDSLFNFDITQMFECLERRTNYKRKNKR